MDSNTYPKRPEWLTDEKIEFFRKAIAECPNPYTDKDISELEFDGLFDCARARARNGIEILSEYGIPFKRYGEK